MIGPDMRRKLRFGAAMAVAGYRIAGKDDATIRRDAVAAMAKVLRSEVADLWEQEELILAFGRVLDAEIKKTGKGGE